jgi:hypothetical protein
MSSLVATKPEHDGAALIDAESPAYFGVGLLAGSIGMNPHKALLLFLGAKIAQAATQHGAAQAVFGKHSGESLGNHVTDVLLEVAGLSIGASLRQYALAQQATAEAPLPPSPEQAAGMGAYYLDPGVYTIG